MPDLKEHSLETLPSDKLTAFLTASDYNLLYASSNYLRMLQRFLEAEVLLITAETRGELQAVFPVMIYSKSALGVVCNSLPFYGSNGSIIVGPGLSERESERIQRLILEYYNDLVQNRLACISSTLITNPLRPDAIAFYDREAKYNYIEDRIGQITRLPEHFEKLMPMFADPRPRNIRKAIKENVRVNWSQDEADIDFLYETHWANITSIGGIPKERRFFDLLSSYFQPSDYRIYIAEHGGRKVGALLLFYFNKTVEYYTPAVVEEARSLQPTSLIIYEAMKDSISMGYKNWNWGGTWLSQGGVYDFKKKWGTTDFPYRYYCHLRDPRLKLLTRETLLKEFPYFYVVPFRELEGQQG